MSSHKQQQSNDASRIMGIQFSILSPEEIRKASVAGITTRDTYVNNKPVIGGLFDPRMGVLEPGLICPTDGLDYIQTPGYFGHIELARPVYYIQFLSTIIKILRCICFKCSKLLISKDKYRKTIDGLSGEARWNKVFQLANKKKRCGEDTEDGCGCKQPNKIKKEGLATLYAEWDNIEGLGPDDQDKLNIKLFPEMVVKMFRRISDEDVTFMGFSPTFSRPDWMICQVLAVPPPSVRPSVKHDSQQRSEDDISHILVNIIKANKTLQEKIDQDAPANVIEDWATVLQYYIATQIDNKIPGVASVAQRSGRPLKSIKERLNGKGGRVRGNLMGKRVDYSARSVITPDPNVSIRELGIPLKVAKNITKPVIVNDKNKAILLKLIKNGPDIHPGAKILERNNGENISLRYIDRESINLENGDIVHRHMQDGDAILFNRQPTLHRMSMMCHIARIMPQADTFRMNVADTKPYNADFDGDEMNLHMPQDVESETELMDLAAVPWQIISPANNKSIVGIFQDSLLGAYRLTRPNIQFTQREAMNLLMSLDKVDSEKLYALGDNVSSFEVLSQIMPPLSMNYKTKDFKSGEDYDTSNHVLDIKNGNITRGQLDKAVLGSGTKGLLQRVCNDYGNMVCADFIDNLQNIVTEYMLSSSYSVGISDLIADKKTNDTIVSTITSKKQEVKSLIDQTHLGVFENKTGKSNNEEFETQVNCILNDAATQAGKIGRESMSADNRFVIMVNAGSKGSELNISQMISCLGQQNVDGKRIPYGFSDRTLPHFTKFNDTPSARGFVESSFIGGLSPEELFFHAQGGRVGLIDTAVKTSQTGYIQRRLIKGMEDLKVEYDMSVRNSKGKVVQFRYGNDSFDTVKVESQHIQLVNMSLEEIYAHFHMPSDNMKDKVFTTSYTQAAIKRLNKQNIALNKKCLEMNDMMIEYRKQIMTHVFKNKSNDKVYLPVAFSYIINNIQAQQNIQSNSLVDITPLEAFELIDNTFNQLLTIKYAKPNDLFKVMYYYYLSPKDLLMVKRFNSKALIILLETIVLQYKKAIIAPGEMVGMIAAQSIGEPTTQMTLNTFHFAGVASKSNVTRGVPRVEEILSLSENPKNPSLTIVLKDEDKKDRQKAQSIMNMIEHTKLADVVSSVQICFDPDDMNSLIEEDQIAMEQFQEFESMVSECNEDELDQDKQKSCWVIRFEIDPTILLDKNITMDDINFAIKNSYKDEVSCVFTDYNSDNLIFRIRMNKILQNKKKTGSQNPLDQSDNIYLLKNFQDQLLQNIILRGVRKVDKITLRKDPTTMFYEDGKYHKQETWVLDSVGTNLLEVLSLDYINVNETTSNDIQEIYNVLGIEAARQSIHNEFSEVIEGDGTYINEHHLGMLCDRMTYSYKMISIFRHGINNDNIGPLAKASFEETPEMFLKAARHAELDPLRGVSANVMCGQEGFYGTNAFQVYLDLNKMSKLTAQTLDTSTTDDKIASMFDIEDPNDPCSTSNLNIQNNCVNIKKVELGDDDDYDISF